MKVRHRKKRRGTRDVIWVKLTHGYLTISYEALMAQPPIQWDATTMPGWLYGYAPVRTRS
jgi:hypothetical protein